MLTDEQIENYLFKYAQTQEELSSYVIEVIAKRVNDIRNLPSFDNLNTLSEHSRTNSDINDITDYVRKIKKRQKELLDDDFWAIAAFLYAESKKFYDEGQIALRQNLELVQEISDLLKATQKALDELTKNQVVVMRDMQNPTLLRAYTLENAYKSIINEASQYKRLTNIDMNIALKRTESQLFRSGVRFTDNLSSKDAERTTSANRAIRTVVLDGIKTLITKVQDVMGKQFGANGLELSAHIYPAPDHAPAQGHQFTKEEVEKMQSGQDFQDVDGNSYAGFVRQIGEWNCRHYFMKIKLGTKPQYSQEQLDKILEDNERGYTDSNGKHHTLYECTQIQRRYEREIRKAKEMYLMNKYFGNKTAMQTSRNRVGKLTTQYKLFSNACDLPIKFERLKVKDYK